MDTSQADLGKGSGGFFLQEGKAAGSGEVCGGAVGVETGGRTGGG